MERFDVNRADLCNDEKPFYAVLASERSMQEQKLICEHLGGQLPRIDNSLELREHIFGIIRQNFGNHTRRSQQYFLGLQGDHSPCSQLPVDIKTKVLF